MDPFPNTLGISLRTQETDLLRELADIGGQREQLLRERFAEAGEFGIVAILGVVLSAEGRWLRGG